MFNVKNFVATWNNRGYEKGDTHTFWLQFLRDVLNVAEPEKFIRFEVPVKLKHISFIDAFFPTSKVIIEQKSLQENLEQGKSQSDGSILTPYEQAQRYGSNLPYSMRPRWIIVSNFKEFLIYDMETLAAPTKILLTELPEKFHIFDFLVDSSKDKIRLELELSLKAGVIVGKLYNALHNQYLHPDDEKSLQSLNKLCVRLVFCLYAESAGIFGKHKIFRDYLQKENNVRRALIDLFQVLNTPVNLRDPYIADELKSFPYVNGRLFDGNIEVPNFTEDIKNLLLDEASSNFNWSGISPTIFGAVFESTLNPLTRRAGGMHYTSIENIHKVIDPLFLDNLKDEFRQIISIANLKLRKKALLDFQNKLSNLKFFDPACGSGNFLTESFICLRRLENDILRDLFGSQIQLGAFLNPVKVSINQFFGVEINDFACTVAKTALWIAELQMLQETQEIIHRDLDFLPLKSYANIHEGNALRLNWRDILPPDINFLMGNPPFVGYKFLTDFQKQDLTNILSNLRSNDYVVGWYFKICEFIQQTPIKVALVSTNSITQGSAIQNFGQPLSEKYIFHIFFAHQTFIWQSESTEMAHVHCVIIGFSFEDLPKKVIFSDSNNFKIVSKINFYLFEGENIIVIRRGSPLSDDAPEMTKGAQLIDGGGFMLNSEEEKQLFLKKYPESEPYIFRYYNAKDFLNNAPPKYCLYLKNCPPNIIRNCAGIKEKVQQVYNYRFNNKSRTTKVLADTPTLFFQSQVPEQTNIVIPVVSSEKRYYIPIGFMPSGNVYTNALFYIDGATLYHFGVLTSSVHMAWVRVVCGRLESRYRYSNDIVYNNFVWCQPTEQQKRAIELTAQHILDVRQSYQNSTLADLYDPLTMPKDLRNAHKKNDAAVMTAYNFSYNFTDSDIITELFKLYQQMQCCQ